ncbi:hypothetical protein BGX38DRAFT_1180912, partial [Terfezia claveryi]
LCHNHLNILLLFLWHLNSPAVIDRDDSFTTLVFPSRVACLDRCRTCGSSCLLAVGTFLHGSLLKPVKVCSRWIQVKFRRLGGFSDMH